jgi:serine/threonine protein phosphatase PrpC
VTAVPDGPDGAAAADAPTCASCGAVLEDGYAFCESCGAPTGIASTGPGPAGDPARPASPTDADAAAGPGAGASLGAGDPGAAGVDGLSARTTLIAHPDDEPTASTPAPSAGDAVERCSACGGRFEDGWCDTCGAPRPDPRDHVVVTLSATLGCVSDRGVQHHRNEDAGTVAHLGAAVACIVADGVSSAAGSQAASAAAVAATGDGLTATVAEEAPASDDAWLTALRRSRRAAAAAASSREVRGAGEDPSCTWVAAVTDGARVWSSWVGDSRAYLVYDDGHGRQLSVDHSWAAEAVAAGADPVAVMADRRAHMITAWLGGDAPEIPDATAVDVVEGPGWLLVVSDGLWNYCDPADDLAALVARLGGPNLQATALAEALVGFANAAGGVDNITVAAARLDPRPDRAIAAPGSTAGPTGAAHTTPTTPGA